MATRIEQATELLRRYWGATGPDRNFQEGRTALRAMKLSRAEVQELVDALPPPQAGPTGERLGECYRFLQSL